MIWKKNSQSELQSQIIPWYDPSSAPSTLEICYTQEDLWILKGILEIIKETNGNAKENFQAPIKEVSWIRMGKAARSNAGSISESVASLGPPGAGGSGPSYGSESASSSNVSTVPSSGMLRPGDVTGGLKPVTKDPADNRYVDSAFNPVPSAKLRSAMKSESPSDAYYAVAKRIRSSFD